MRKILAYEFTESRLTKFANVVLATVIIAVICYMSFSALQGNHGLFRLFQIKSQELRIRSELDDLQQRLAVLENKTQRLSTEHLDIELLDEQARKVLGLGRADEILIQ